MNTLRANWLKKTLNRLFEYLDETFYINEGGCCFVAYVLAKRLEYIGEEFKLVLYDNDLEFTNSSEVKESIENRDTQKCPNGCHTCCHYAIMIENIGILNPSDFDDEKEMIIKGVSSDDILWIYEQGRWNDNYNSALNDIIEQNINSVFDAYERIF